MDVVLEISRLANWPTARDFLVPWGVVEEDLNTAIPSDYKALVEYFGPGEFSPFLQLLIPGVQSPALELRVTAAGFFEAANEPGDIRAFEPYSIFPSPGGLLPCATAGTGEVFYWNTGPAHPDRWPVVARESRGHGVFEFNGGIGEFMVALFDGRIDVPFIPPLRRDEFLEFIPDDGAWPYSGALDQISFFRDGGVANGA